MNCFRPLQLLALSLYTRRAPWPRRARAAAPRNSDPLASFASFAALVALVALLLSAGPAQAASTTFNGSAVAGCSYDSNNKTYTCSALPLTNDTDSITVASGYTVLANPAVSFSYNQSLTLSGSAIFGSYGNLSIAAMNPANLHLSGGYLGSAANFTMGDQTISASIYAASISIGTGAAARVNGFVYATGAVTMASNVTVTGDVTGASLSLGAGASTINGNVSMSGDVAIGSGSTINGNLSARNVTTQDSNGIITGNASVNALTLGYGGRVEKTITCTGSGASGCSCVTNNSGYNAGSPNAPACTPPQNPPSTLDHIQLSYSSPGLTCQPLAVTLKACANAACTSTYANQVTLTLTPNPAGGQSFTFTGTGQASVQQTTAVAVTLTTAGSGAANSDVCVDGGGGSNCQVSFADSGFVFGAIPGHKSATTQSFTISALQKSSSSPKACDTALNSQKIVTLGCTYSNPSTGTMGPTITGSSAATLGACGGAGSTVSLNFVNGVAQASMSYPDVGQLSLKASYNSGGTQLSGASSVFTVAPASIGIDAHTSAKANPGTTTATGTVFLGAGQPFTLALKALNSNGAVTPNFGRESAPESFAVSNSPLALSWTTNTDASGNLIGANPAIALTGTALANGIATSSATWNEVGSFKLTASLANSSGYLGSGMSATGTGVVGRFVPDHFGTALSGAVPMACNSPTVATTFSTVCATPQFVYSLQPFDVAVTAYSAGGTATQNYQGQLARAVTFSLWTAAGGSTATPAAAASPSTGLSIGLGTSASGAPTLPATAFAAGVATTSAGSGQPNLHFGYGYVHPPTGNQSPATPGVASGVAPTAAWLRAAEPAGADGVTSLRSSGSVEAGVTVASGRLLVGNNYGAETSSMPVTVKAQYWNGKAWQNNTAFAGAATVSTSGAPNLFFDDCKKSFVNGSAGSVCKNPPLTVGNGTLTFPAAPASTGAATFTFNPPGAAGASSLLVSPFPYLPTTVGQLVFGVYRAGPVIYLREVY